MAFATFFFGLLLTFGGVGGIDNSVDTVSLAQASVISIVGLVFMFVSTTYFKEIA